METRKIIEDLVSRYQQGDHSNEILLQLWEQVRSGACKYANQMARSDRSLLEDYVQEGFLALYPALRTYKPDKGSSFFTWYYWHLQKAYNRLRYRSTGATVSVAKLAKAAQVVGTGKVAEGMDPAEAKLIYAAKYGHIDIMSTIPGTEGISIQEGLEGPSNNVQEAQEALENDHLSMILWREINETLADKEREILTIVYRDGIRCADAARITGVSRQSASATHKRALGKLRSNGFVMDLAADYMSD